MPDSDRQNELLEMSSSAAEEVFEETAPVPESAQEPGSAEVSFVPADNGLSGYMIHTETGNKAPDRTSGKEDSHESDPDEDGHSHDREWMAYASIVGGALSIYSSPMVFSGVMLGVSAIVIGILGSFGKKKALSVIGILAGLAGLILSVLLASLYIELFRIVSGYLTGGFGFRIYSGW
ncbi:MAG: hypothetical protein J5744_02285 [Oscillospiraceae bacterium]|nr:hypothetical protein [Oscillospiraceae bacterium]